jgi:hypothetical protein
MPERVLVDNDVALKVSCYDLIDETLAVTTRGAVVPAMLGVGRFVIRGRLAKARNVANTAAATLAFERLLAGMGAVEPDDAELSLAADLFTKVGGIAAGVADRPSRPVAVARPISRHGKMKRCSFPLRSVAGVGWQVDALSRPSPER